MVTVVALISPSRTGVYENLVVWGFTTIELDTKLSVNDRLGCFPFNADCNPEVLEIDKSLSFMLFYFPFIVFSTFKMVGSVKLF